MAWGISRLQKGPEVGEVPGSGGPKKQSSVDLKARIYCIDDQGVTTKGSLLVPRGVCS